MKLITCLVLGRLAVWTIQTNGLTSPLFDLHTKLQELRDCDFCLGVWVFTGLAMALGINLLEPLYLPVLSEALTGLALSFGVHLAMLGWEMKFGVVHLGEH